MPIVGMPGGIPGIPIPGGGIPMGNKGGRVRAGGEAIVGPIPDGAGFGGGQPPGACPNIGGCPLNKMNNV